MKTSSLWLALCLCVASVAQADVTMTMETTSRDGHTETRQLFLGQDRLSMDGVLIYRGDLGKLWILDGNTYHEITKETLEMMAAKMGEMSDAMAQMKEQMAAAEEALEGLPEPQREMALKQLRAAGGFETPAAEGLTVDATGESQKWGGFDCKGYVVKNGDTRTMRVWTTDAKAAGLTSKDLGVLESFGDFIGSADMPMLAELRRMLRDYTKEPEAGEAPGLPVRMERFTGPNAGEVSLLTGIEHGKLDPAHFELPEGAKLAPSPFGSNAPR